MMSIEMDFRNARIAPGPVPATANPPLAPAGRVDPGRLQMNAARQPAASPSLFSLDRRHDFL